MQMLSAHRGLFGHFYARVWSQGYVLAAARLQQYLVPLLVAPKQDLDAAVVCSDRVHNLKHSEPN